MTWAASALFVVALVAPLPGDAAEFADLWTTWSVWQGLAVAAEWDAGTARACAERAQVLASQGGLSHVDASGRGPGQQMDGQLGPGEWGEILGAGPSLIQVFEAWTRSPSHRSVLADPRWQRWGLGHASSGGSQVFVVRFWRP